MANLAFAENMKHLREHNSLKQAEMLMQLGYKQSTWNGYERGASSPNLDDLIRISDFFGILESDLLRTQVAGSDINELYDNYISKQHKPITNKETPRSEAFLSYCNGAGKKAPHPEKPQARGLRYTNEPPAAAHIAATETARIDRLEDIVRAIKNVLEQLDK